MGKFLELGKCKLSENKNLVISMDAERRISIAQQLVVTNEGVQQNIFLKNAINLDVEGLKKLYDIIGEIISKN